MNTEITVPYWFDVWYRNVDVAGFESNRQKVAIKKISDQGWGHSFLDNISPSQHPDVLPVGLDQLDLQKYVDQNKIVLIEAIIHGYEIEE